MGFLKAEALETEILKATKEVIREQCGCGVDLRTGSSGDLDRVVLQ